MDLQHLRTFVIVATEEGVTRAAQRLYMTPPTVSAHIKALEEELGVRLFVRTSKGMILTEKGKLLKEKAEQTLDAAQDLVNHATELQAHLIGKMNFAINASPGFLQVASLVQMLEVACPGITLTFSSSSTGKILEGLESRMFDIGYIFGPAPTPALRVHPLKQVDLRIAAPSSWATKIANASWAELAELPWIHSSYYCPFQKIVERLFQEQGLEIARCVEADADQTKLSLVQEGVGLTLLVGDECRQAQAEGNVIAWDGPQIGCQLNLAYLEQRKDDPLMAALVEVVLSLWQQPTLHTES